MVKRNSAMKTRLLVDMMLAGKHLASYYDWDEYIEEKP